MDESARALVRLARRACEGNTSRPPAVCAAAAEATLRETRLPALPRFEWLAIGALAFLGGGAAALFGAPGRRLLPAVVSASGAIVAAVTLLTRS